MLLARMDSGDLVGFQPLVHLLAGKETEIELDRAALLLATLEYPNLDVSAYLRDLDDMAAVIGDLAQDLSDAQDFLETTCSYLFGTLNFHGNGADYYNPENSCLNRVLETRCGIPITLSVVLIELSRRLAKPVFGVGLPGHFIVRYEDDSSIAFIDPFHSGAIIDEARCYELAGLDTPDPTVLEPVGTRYIIFRMINNLRAIYFSRSQPQKALQLLDLLLAAMPDSAEEHKQRGVALVQLSRLAEALEAFQMYLKLLPDAPDKEKVKDQMKSIVYWMASRN